MRQVKIINLPLSLPPELLEDCAAIYFMLFPCILGYKLQLPLINSTGSIIMKSPFNQHVPQLLVKRWVKPSGNNILNHDFWCFPIPKTVIQLSQVPEPIAGGAFKGGHHLRFSTKSWDFHGISHGISLASMRSPFL